MPYISFAVVGAGTIGSRIVQALIERNVSVVVIKRPGSKSTESSLPERAKIVRAEYSDVKAVSAILREHKVEVVISALAYEALGQQYLIADAAKEANVKLFVPSEYGMPTEGTTDPGILIKHQVAEYSKSRGVPVLRIYNGIFTEFIPWLTCVQLGKFHLLGEHTNSTSFTSMDDVAGYIAHILTTLPNESLENATFRIEGDRQSLSSIGVLYEALNPPVPVERVTELPEGIIAQTFVQQTLGERKNSSGWDNYSKKDDPSNANSGNKFWEGHEWKSVKEVLKL